MTDNFEHTTLCAGADTCEARAILEPLLVERDRLRVALIAAVSYISAYCQEHECFDSEQRAEAQRICEQGREALP
jgi:hypothetical protein